MPLDAKEREKFTAAQLAQLDRSTQLDKYLGRTAALEGETVTPEQAAEHRAKALGQWQAMGPRKLRMRVNIDSFGSRVAYSKDNDYTAEEQDAIGWGWKANVGRKADVEIPAVLAHMAEMRADGLGAAMVK